MPKIISLLPDHDHFVVPFGGSGPEILAKARSNLETFNNKDELLHNLYWSILHGDFNELQRRVQETPCRSKWFFDQAVRILEQPIRNRLEAAWAFLVAANNRFQCHSKARWAYNRKGFASRWPRLPNALRFVKWRFQNVQLLHHDWSVVVEKLDEPKTLFLCDPSYHPDLLEPNKPYYRHMLSAEDHESMLLKLRQVKGYVILCGYPHPLYGRLLSDWRRVDTGVKALMAVNGQRSPRTEVMWLNYAPDGTRI
jgi:DNA adenine methylase